jgi:hypothetical protein
LKCAEEEEEEEHKKGVEMCRRRKIRGVHGCVVN